MRSGNTELACSQHDSAAGLIEFCIMEHHKFLNWGAEFALGQGFIRAMQLPKPQRCIVEGKTICKTTYIQLLCYPKMRRSENKPRPGLTHYC